MIFDQNQSLKNYLRSLEYRKKKYKKTIKTLKLGLIWKNVLKVKNKTNFGHLEKLFIQQAWKKTFLTIYIYIYIFDIFKKNKIYSKPKNDFRTSLKVQIFKNTLEVKNNTTSKV